MAYELYIYFRASANHAEAVQAAVTAMQSRLRAEFPGLQARLLRRTGASAGHDTWMETYAMAPTAGAVVVDDALGATLAQRAAAWCDLLEGPRHVEVFEPCA